MDSYGDKAVCRRSCRSCKRLQWSHAELLVEGLNRNRSDLNQDPPCRWTGVGWRIRRMSTPLVARRRFLAASSATVAAFSLVPRHVLGGPNQKAPSEKLNIAGIGVGGMGATNLRN